MTKETVIEGVVPPYQAPREEPDLIGTVVGGRYRIRRKLGQGGMGAVYAAEQEPLGREVALKIVRGDLARQPRYVERFRREAKTLSALVHPHVVALYDFGIAEEGTLYFAMELLPGESLRERLHACGRMSAAATLPIVREMCSALGAAHALGVLHRDLKPDNVMLIEAFGRRDFVKLLDFGIAKAVGGESDLGEAQSLTQSGTLVGTPGYVAREVAVDGVHDDKRSDLYAVGVTWFEMLTGRAPFVAQTAVGLIMKHANEPAPPVAALVPDVPPGVAALVDELLAKDPRARPASADALIARLDALALPSTHATDSFVLAPAPALAPRGTAPFLDAIPSTLTIATPRRDVAEVALRPSRRPLLKAAAIALLVAAIAAVAALALPSRERSRRKPAPAEPVEPALVAPVVPVEAEVEAEVEADVEAVEVEPRAERAVKKPPKPKLLEPKEQPKLID